MAFSVAAIRFTFTITFDIGAMLRRHPNALVHVAQRRGKRLVVPVDVDQVRFDQHVRDLTVDRHRRGVRVPAELVGLDEDGGVAPADDLVALDRCHSRPS